MAGDRSDSGDVSMKNASPLPSGKKTHKRKRDLDGSTLSSSTPTKKSKKDQNEPATPVSDKKSKKKEKSGSVSVDKRSKDSNGSAKSTKKESAVSPISEKAKSSGDTGSKRKKSKSRLESYNPAGGDSDADEEATDLKDNTNSKETAKAKKQKRLQTTDQSAEDADSNRTKNKFAGILSKFERSAKVKKAAEERGYQEEIPDKDENAAEPVVAQGLEPIPQPAPVLEEAEKPSYSSLPAWLANPLRTSAETRTKFSDLGVESKLLRVLENNGYKEAFAVQSAVIPLLLRGSKTHPGDLCVSAATGSGKTLSYVLPLVTELEQIPAPRLRGLIVVPTRELVKQAREACEFCTAGTGLRVGSAVGNVAIKDEQRSLMRVDQVYSPTDVEARQEARLTGDEWAQFSLQDYITDTTDLGETLPGYIHKVEPNVDILICTPGRLVDHLRYTRGFTLKHLQWLVIDEADRLLNESFQEWVDVVMNSLDARRASEAFGSTGQFLANLGLPLQTQEPRKVILSATMTRDISKLNSLRLTNPKMVIVGADSGVTGDDESGMAASADERFTLPTTLKEYSVAVGDGAQKPLYLLRLLLDEIKLAVSSTKISKAAASASDESSSEGSSSDETSSDDSSSEDSSSEDSGSDSDSESDTSEDSSSSEESESSDSSSESDSEVEEPNKTTSNSSPLQNTVLVFTKSSESASRLSRLLALLEPSLSGLIGTIIKSNKSSASRKTLSAYRQGKLSIIIATDRASRGLDLQSLSHVINYDVPASVTTYVHRVGRTARAGKEGSAWTLVAHREGRWFTNEISKSADGKITRATKVERVPIKLSNMKEVKSRYAAALDVLEKEVKAIGTKKEAI